MSKGYGFVEFTNKDGYSSAVAQDHHVLENSKVQLLILSLSCSCYKCQVGSGSATFLMVIQWFCQLAVKFCWNWNLY